MKNIAKILCFVLSLALVFSIVGLSTFADEATSSLSGEGTAENPYLINNLADLITFRDEVNSGIGFAGQYVKLNADIDLFGIDWSVNIGDDCNATFDGYFDGDNHTIKNLKSIETAQKGDGYVCTGLFGAIYGDASIKNLTIENAKIDAGEFSGINVGVVVGFAYACTGSIENVTVCGDVKIDAPQCTAVGTILGYDYYGDVTITNCAVNANAGSYINAASQVGGIVGYAGTKCEITDCSVENLAISAKGLAGGIVGVANGDGTQLVTVTNASVKNVAITVYGEFWQSSGAVVIGSLGGKTAVITGTTFENVTVNGAAVSNLAGSGYVNKPTSPVAPVAASINGKFYTDLQAAIDAAAEGDVIVIANDIALSESIVLPTDKAVVIDLNGFTIAGTDNATDNFSLFNGTDADLTINDSVGGGKITLIATNNRGWGALSAIINNRGGVVTINGGALEHLGGTDMAFVVDNSANYHGDATLTVNGGSLVSTYTAIRLYMSNDHVGGTSIVEINDGYIYGGSRGIWGQAPSNGAGQTATITINGGTIAAPADTGAAINVQRTANADADVVINGGTFNAPLYMEAQELLINDGTFNGALYLKDESNNDVASASSIKGGAFATDVSAFVADGYRLIQKADGSYGATQGSSTPEIIDGYWWIGGVNTGMPASPSVEMVECPEHGVICWYVNGTCTGIQAVGTEATLPEVAVIDGYWYIDNKDGKGLLPTGIKAEGAEGITIVKIEKNAEASDALVSTYVITFSNGQTWSFVVTNGLPGAEGPQGPQGPEGPKGQQGNQGLPGADANDNNKTVIILIAISAVCIIFSLAVILYRGIDRRSWWCTR